MWNLMQSLWTISVHMKSRTEPLLKFCWILLNLTCSEEQRQSLLMILEAATLWNSHTTGFMSFSFCWFCAWTGFTFASCAFVGQFRLLKVTENSNCGCGWCEVDKSQEKLFLCLRRTEYCECVGGWRLTESHHSQRRDFLWYLNPLQKMGKFQNLWVISELWWSATPLLHTVPSSGGAVTQCSSWG